MNLQGLLQAQRHQLTPTDWQIIECLHQQKEDLGKLTMKGLAQACHVSTTTVFRCCQKLGLSGFGELKALLKNQALPELDHDLLSRTYHAIVNYIHQYDTSTLFAQLQTRQALFILARTETELRVAKEIQRIFQQSHLYLFILPSDQALVAQLPQMPQSLLWILNIDSPQALPTHCHHHEAMKSVYSLLMSPMQGLDFLYDDVFFIPSISDQELPMGQHIITPYILAAETLYLKLQLADH